MKRLNVFAGSRNQNLTTFSNNHQFTPVADNSKGGSSEGTTGGGQQSSAQKTPSTGTLFGRLLAADLLARGILGIANAEDYDTTDFSNVHLMMLQTLESGGGVLTRGGLFKGNRVNFSGGAAATFSLFDLEDGSIECAGNAFAYSGYFQQDRYPTALRNDEVRVPLQLTSQSGDCQASTDGPLRTWRRELKVPPLGR